MANWGPRTTVLRCFNPFSDNKKKKTSKWKPLSRPWITGSLEHFKVVFLMLSGLIQTVLWIAIYLTWNKWVQTCHIIAVVMWSVHCEDIFMLFSETLVYEIIIPHNRGNSSPHLPRGLVKWHVVKHLLRAKHNMRPGLFLACTCQ